MSRRQTPAESPAPTERRKVGGPALVLAALGVFAGAGVATAQTVYVTHAPPGTTVELVRDTTVVASTAVDASGLATLVVPEPDRRQMDALIFIDECRERRRVLIVQRGLQAAPTEIDCTRREIPGVFLVRPISTLVVNLEGPTPRLLLRQGPFDPTAPPRTRVPVPTGLVFSGSAGLRTFADATATTCGNVAGCEGDGAGRGFTAGGGYWFTPFVGAEASYVRPREWTAARSGEDFSFTSFLDVEMLTIAGTAGAPVGPVRLYGKAGTNFHRATFSTTQTIEELTVTVDGVTHITQGGAQTLAFRTEGWGWLFGGGFEAWLARSFAIYAEAGFAGLRGSEVEGAEAAMKDRLTLLVVGARLHIGR
jgi:hypothetical protein